MRDKLIELIKDAEAYSKNECLRTPCFFCEERENNKRNCKYGFESDYLIANGVTVQQWIPVSEMPPTYTSNYLVYLAQPVDGKHFPLGHDIAAYIARDDCWDLAGPYIVTHWMPLPAAPKEVT